MTELTVWRVELRKGFGQRRYIGVEAATARDAADAAWRAYEPEWQVGVVQAEPERPVDMTEMTLSQKLASQRRAKAEAAFHRAELHGCDTVHGRAYVREGFHWLRAVRDAEAGNNSPWPWEG